VVDFHSIIDHCNHYLELSHDELDFVIKAHRFSVQHTWARKKKAIKSTFSMDFRFADTHFVFPMVLKGNKKRRNATKPGFQRFNQVLI